MDDFDTEELSTLQRKALLAALVYERTRRDAGQRNYKLPFRQKEDITKDPVFKQFQTLVKWIEEFGWEVRWSEVSWKGYFSFCFKHLHPKRPQPGQLKNKKLLREFLRDLPDIPRRTKTDAQLQELYRSILRPELKSWEVRRKGFGLV